MGGGGRVQGRRDTEVLQVSDEGLGETECFDVTRL